MVVKCKRAVWIHLHRRGCTWDCRIWALGSQGSCVGGIQGRICISLTSEVVESSREGSTVGNTNCMCTCLVIKAVSYIDYCYRYIYVYITINNKLPERTTRSLTLRPLLKKIFACVLKSENGEGMFPMVLDARDSFPSLLPVSTSHNAFLN